MKRALLVLALPFVLGMSWQDMYVRINSGLVTNVGTINETAGTPKDNGTTSSPFTLTSPNCYRVQCLAAAFILPVAAGSFTTGQELWQANALAGPYCFHQQSATYVPKITVDFSSGTSSCKVQRMDPTQ